MPEYYQIEFGKLNGNYKVLYKTQSGRAAWRAFYETAITSGEKKRIRVKKGRAGQWRILKRERAYWT